MMFLANIIELINLPVPILIASITRPNDSYKTVILTSPTGHAGESRKSN